MSFAFSLTLPIFQLILQRICFWLCLCIYLIGSQWLSHFLHDTGSCLHKLLIIRTLTKSVCLLRAFKNQRVGKPCWKKIYIMSCTNFPFILLLWILGKEINFGLSLRWIFNGSWQELRIPSRDFYFVYFNYDDT